MVASVACPPPKATTLEPAIPSAMLRIHGDRLSLLAALAAHWADQQLQLPAAPRSTGRGGPEAGISSSARRGSWRGSIMKR